MADNKVFNTIVGIAAIVTCIATVLIVPEIRQWVGLEQPDSSPPPTPTSMSVVTIRPLLDNIENYVALWSLTTPSLVDPKSPSTLTYSASVNHEEYYSWKFGWCATDPENLPIILKPFSMEFLVDNVPITSSDILEYERPNCHYWATLLTKLKGNSSLKLEITYTLSEGITDGNNYYAPGQYRHIINVNVE